MIRIAHVGGWGRNYGDLALQDGQMRVLREDSEQPLEFLPIHCQQTEFHPDLIDRLNETCDLMILGGGGMIFHRPEDSSRSGWQFNIALEDLDRIRIPIAVYAVGYNPFHFDSQKLLPVAMEHLKATQDRALMFSVRNNGSRNALIKGGLDPERIEILPDPGMYVPSYPLTLPQSANANLKIGLNWAGDRPHFRFPEPWEENRLGLIDALCGAFLELASDYPGLQVYFIPHLENRIDSDVWELFSERLGDRILNLEDDVARMFPPSRAQAGFLADTYRQMDISIGMRGHANIIPFGMNTPLLGLGSHDKVGFFLEEVGLAENWLSTQSDTKAGGAAGIAAKIRGVLQNRSVMKQDMALQLKDCRQATRDFHKRMFAAL
ncbi:polysaccharide pyruvyl transferase family protein [Roseibium polysiphoniae]|uniref:polysaccharide pyruvyl transferase family protein n=1 Tax=Roseibium polysiphoniae TaxID=2571221 RepID=UPI00329A3679